MMSTRLMDARAECSNFWAGSPPQAANVHVRTHARQNWGTRCMGAVPAPPEVHTRLRAGGRRVAAILIQMPHPKIRWASQSCGDKLIRASIARRDIEGMLRIALKRR